MRIGHKMQAVADYVARNPGCSKLAAGRAAWGGGRARMGYLYGPVNRAIIAGIVDATRLPSGRYELRAPGDSK